MRGEDEFTWRCYLKKLLSVILASFSIIMCLSGCGETPVEDTTLLNYYNNSDVFYNNVTYLHEKINNININDENAADQLLNYLDKLNEQVKSFSELEEPDEYEFLSEVIDEASSYMEEAVTYYHMAYSNEAYNATYGDYADKNYERACKRLNIVLDFMHDKYSDSDVITIN